jgi:deoxyribodipyrimidine photo-lyase
MTHKKNLTPPVIYCVSYDTRFGDNFAFFHAVQTGQPLIIVYIHEDDTESEQFYGSAQKIRIRESLAWFQKTLKTNYNARLIIRIGNRLQIIQELIAQTGANAVYWNRRYLPHQIKFDTELKQALKANNINALSFKAHLLFEPHEIKNQTGNFYKVYTPFKKACLLAGFDAPPLPIVPAFNPYTEHLHSIELDTLYPMPNNPDWASDMLTLWDFSENGALKRLDAFIKNGLDGYKEKRNFPALSQHTSQLSPYLAQGLISPRQIIYALQDIPESKDKDHFISEILWREFSYHLIFYAPYMITGNFKPEWDKFPWAWDKQDQENFKKWCKGKTGIPIIDAGMMQLWQTGYMHNRTRMIVASYLVKHLLIDWKHGEAWFKDTLLDYDTANNIAGWQWVAGSGADAAPYFRIFNPILQSKKFDENADYIKQYCPRLKNASAAMIHETDNNMNDIMRYYAYDKPLIDLNIGRDRALKAYEILKQDNQHNNNQHNKE